MVGKIVDRDAKRLALLEWSQASGIDLAQSIAVGDGSNDLSMMQAAGLSVAFNAKAVVRDSANLVIQGNDLRELGVVLGLIA